MNRTKFITTPYGPVMVDKGGRARPIFKGMKRPQPERERHLQGMLVRSLGKIVRHFDILEVGVDGVLETEVLGADAEGVPRGMGADFPSQTPEAS